MADRKEFLKTIRHRTRAGRYKPTHAPDVPWTPKDEPRKEQRIEDSPSRFLEELEALGGHGLLAESLEEAREYILDLAREREAGMLIRWDVEELEQLGVDEPLQKAGVEVAVWRDLEDSRQVAARADVGLSTAEWAVAETGSLILRNGRGMGRTVTLLPPTYVAVIPAEKVLPTIGDVLEKYEGRLPNNLCFHTGPSRSGDIEMLLTIGVHGPGDVHVVIIRES